MCWLPSWGHRWAWQKQVSSQNITLIPELLKVVQISIKYTTGGQTLWWWTRTLPSQTLRWVTSLAAEGLDEVSPPILLSPSQDTLKSFIRRDDIDIILINQNVAEMVSHHLGGQILHLRIIRNNNLSKVSCKCKSSWSILTRILLMEILHFQICRCVMFLMPILPHCLPYLKSQARTGQFGQWVLHVLLADCVFESIFFRIFFIFQPLRREQRLYSEESEGDVQCWRHEIERDYFFWWRILHQVETAIIVSAARSDELSSLENSQKDFHIYPFVNVSFVFFWLIRSLVTPVAFIYSVIANDLRNHHPIYCNFRSKSCEWMCLLHTVE